VTKNTFFKSQTLCETALQLTNLEIRKLETELAKFNSIFGRLYGNARVFPYKVVRFVNIADAIVKVVQFQAL